eukprot:411456-Hanusia_phi.AAC.1
MWHGAAVRSSPGFHRRSEQEACYLGSCTLNSHRRHALSGEVGMGRESGKTTQCQSEREEPEGMKYRLGIEDGERRAEGGRGEGELRYELRRIGPAKSSLSWGRAARPTVTGRLPRERFGLSVRKGGRQTQSVICEEMWFRIFYQKHGPIGTPVMFLLTIRLTALFYHNAVTGSHVTIYSPRSNRSSCT